MNADRIPNKCLLLTHVLERWWDVNCQYYNNSARVSDLCCHLYWVVVQQETAQENMDQMLFDRQEGSQYREM